MLTSAIQRLRALFSPAPDHDCALVLSGGGARASYQAGVLQYIAEVFPETRFSILTGVSAGAINAAQLASHPGSLYQAADHLATCWNDITADRVFEPESRLSLVRRVITRSAAEEKGIDLGWDTIERPALVDTAPLRSFLVEKLHADDGALTGVAHNLKNGHLKAFCVTATNYGTGQTVTWVQGKEIVNWQRPNRVGVHTTMTVDHIMASTSLPLLFPAVRIGNAWFGDGGIRLSSPLSPAVHLGADSILVISTRYRRSRSEADRPSVVGYPPVAQIMGILMNAVFLDVLDQDALIMRRINHLVRSLPRWRRDGFRPIKLLMIRPSVDIGKMAGEYELKVEGALQLLTMGLGSRRTNSPDWLSMLLFERDYISRLMHIGWKDARAQHDRIARFLDESVPSMDGDAATEES